MSNKHKDGRPTGSQEEPRPKKFKILFLVAFLLAALAVGAHFPVIIASPATGGAFLTSGYKMQEDDFHNPRLRLLRQREHLDKVVAPGSTELEKIILLRKWTRAQWESKGVFYYPAWDAVEILDLARNNGNCGFCAQYAIVFLQACQSMGLHARYVELPGHFLVGVWSDDYNYWMVMDPSNDIHYERDGLPLRGGQICRAYWKNDEKGIFKVKSDGTRQPVTHDDLYVYRMYSIVKNANQLTDPPLMQVNDGPYYKLKHEDDYRRYPLVGRDKVVIGSPYLGWKEKEAKENFKDKPLSDDPDDFRYLMNQTLVFPARRDTEKGMMKIVLYAEDAPTAEKFLVKLDNTDWQTVEAREVVWILHSGSNMLRARVQTRDGWKGPITELKAFYKPKWL